MPFFVATYEMKLLSIAGVSAECARYGAYT
jgi:hypothetical protein